MAKFKEFDRSQGFLLPPDLREWVPDDDLAHFVVAAVERVEIAAFKVNWRGTGKAQYHPRLMLALLIYGYANGIFSSRRLERATYRDVAVRFIAANSHPDHDTIATFRRANQPAIERAFAEVLLLAREVGLLRLGVVSLDGTKMDANASKIRSLRYDRAQELRAQLQADIRALMAEAEAADAEDAADPQALPAEIARREALKSKLDAACARLEAEARAEAEAAAKASEDGDEDGDGEGGHAPAPAAVRPPPERQTNLTDPDSALMRKSRRHEFRQAYNAQAAVDADGSQLVLATEVARTPSDAPTFQDTVDALEAILGRPETILADAGFANGDVVGALEKRGIEVLVAVDRSEAQRPYDFRPPPAPDKPPPRPPKAPWRRAMRAKLRAEAAKAKYDRRKWTVEPVFGILKSVLGFTRFHLRGLANVKSEWQLLTLAYNCKRLHKLRPA